MNRPICLGCRDLVVLDAGVGPAQGLLIVEDPNQQVRLPRPIIIWPPYPHPLPHPVPPRSR